MIGILTKYTVLFFATLLVLAGLSYLLAFMFPGDVISNLTGIYPSSVIERQWLETEYKLDRNIFIQFWFYLKQLFIGNWGESFVSGLSLKQQVFIALPATMELTTYAMLITLLVGFPLGCYSGIRAFSKADVAINTSSVVIYSFPVYWLALLLIMLMSLHFQIMPLSGRISLLFDIPHKTGFLLIDIMMQDQFSKLVALQNALVHILLPTLSISLVSTSILIRIVRRAVIEILQKPYVAAARSKGFSEWQIFTRHIFRNALLAILPSMAILITSMLTNAIIVETIFSWPGIGNWLIQAIYQRDYPALRIGMLIVSSIVVTLTILVDFINRLIDPNRERLDGAAT